MVQRNRRKGQGNGGYLPADLVRVRPAFSLRLARKEQEGRKEWGGACAVDVCERVAKRAALGWLIAEEMILSPTRGQRRGGVASAEHANVGPRLSPSVNLCLPGRVDDWQGEDAKGSGETAALSLPRSSPRSPHGHLLGSTLLLQVDLKNAIQWHG